MLAALDSRLLAVSEWLVDFCWEWLSISRRQLLQACSVGLLLGEWFSSIHSPWRWFDWLISFAGAGLFWFGLYKVRDRWLRVSMALVWIVGSLFPWNAAADELERACYLTGMYLCAVGDSSKPRGGKRNALLKKLVPSGNPSVVLPEPGRA
jgi:hypothetical protein